MEMNEMKIETIKPLEKVFTCRECEGKMYRLQGSETNTYVCEKCGYSFEYKESPDFDRKNSSFDRCEDINVGHRSIRDIFNDNFMKKYTNYDTFKEFIDHCDFFPKTDGIVTYEDFNEIPRDEIDHFVKSNTVFNTWDEMFEKASGRYLKIEFNFN